MPNRIMPPGSADASSTVTSWPSSARSWAAESPAGPAPTTATLRRWGPSGPSGRTGRCPAKRFPSVTSASRSRSWVPGRMDSTPYCSQTVRLSARMATGEAQAPTGASARGFSAL